MKDIDIYLQTRDRRQMSTDFERPIGLGFIGRDADIRETRVSDIQMHAHVCCQIGHDLVLGDGTEDLWIESACFVALRCIAVDRSPCILIRESEFGQYLPEMLGLRAAYPRVYGLKIAHEQREEVLHIRRTEIVHPHAFVVKTYACREVPFAELKTTLMVRCSAVMKHIERAGNR